MFKYYGFNDTHTQNRIVPKSKEVEIKKIVVDQ